MQERYRLIVKAQGIPGNEEKSAQFEAQNLINVPSTIR